MQQQSQSNPELYEELSRASSGDMTSLWYIGLSMFLFCLLCNLGRRFSRVEQRLYELDSNYKKLSADRLIGDYCLGVKVDQQREQSDRDD
jgi:hypothetical protein